MSSLIIIFVLISFLLICYFLYKKILKITDKLERLDEYLIFQQVFNKEYEKCKNDIFTFKIIEMSLRTDYLL